jgi:hypothetical protein
MLRAWPGQNWPEWLWWEKGIFLYQTMVMMMVVVVITIDDTVSILA